ncbi:phosphatases II [Cylindrobasidium torrendii FP15055 ss-10]|uniref:protein-tyrosine-phosphatase n=1 Tax=Cylindrobasidium torrendii FP15055 ss-10 TaxID=1314674 RepID=A0A0D7B5L3_9AGAR|nr:phosphatases II [Cylindrobasidium torrendii FP15055 ss-10]
MKNLSLNLDSAGPASASSPTSIKSLALPVPPTPGTGIRPRRPSVVSLPPPNTAALLNFRENPDQADAPYANGPVEITPGIWLGSEDNARDWSGLAERKIKAILNVAKEVISPFDAIKPLRAVSSVPNFTTPSASSSSAVDNSYYPPNLATGRPGMHYLKLMWSHGQQNLVNSGFSDGMAFVDAARTRGEGVLVHCQCGISRSATMVIALVMRAAAAGSSELPDLKGMQPAYDFVKEKSPCIGPNMSLIYQLLDYEHKLNGGSDSERSSAADEEEEWGRRRRMMDEESDKDSLMVQEEAQLLDKAMEERIASRKSSASSLGIGMGAAWRSRYGPGRKRAGSIASTAGSAVSEDLIEVEEENDLLAVGGGFTDETASTASTNSPDDEGGSRVPPPSAPIWKTSFHLPPPPASTTRASFSDIGLGHPKSKRRPPRLLAPVPPSPTSVVLETLSSSPEEEKPSVPAIIRTAASPVAAPGTPFRPRPRELSLRQRRDSRKPAPPPLHLRNSVVQTANDLSSSFSSTESIGKSRGHLKTPSQTLFVFPPSPTQDIAMETPLPPSRTPSIMTLSNMMPPGGVPFPAMTPRVSTFRSHGRTRSFIGIAAPPTPTTAFSKVDAKGWVQPM